MQSVVHVLANQHWVTIEKNGTTIAAVTVVAMVAKIGSICKRSLTKWLSFSRAVGARESSKQRDTLLSKNIFCV
jgi:hypothetical protein